MQYLIDPQYRTVGCVAAARGHKEADNSMPMYLTDAKLRAIMLVMRSDDEAVRQFAAALKPVPGPLVLSHAFGEVLRNGIPVEFTVPNGEHAIRLRLPDGYSDTEGVGEAIVKPYNMALKVLGNSALLPDDLRYGDLCRAHTLIHKVLTKDAKPVPPVQFTAAPKPEEASLTMPIHANPKPQPAVPDPTTPSRDGFRPYVWRTKSGKEIRLTEAQWNYRVRQAGGLGQVPVGCGQVDEIEPHRAELADDEDVEWEWGDDDVPVVVDVHKIAAVLEQQPEPEAMAKPVIQDIRALLGVNA